MKLIAISLLLLGPVAAQPLLSSWRTADSGRYARIYETTEDQNAGNAVTTWNRGAGVQETPTYAGIHEISSTATHVYIRTTGLGSHIMGPWYGATGNLFPNYPANAAATFAVPFTPNPAPATPALTGGGAIGYFVDGVAMFDSRDAFSYSNATNTDAQNNGGDRVWNSDAYVNESVTFDPANAHQAGSNYHYHANPPGLRYQLGDSVDYDPANNSYSETFNGQHSPILGWVRDGYPIYGPYGYSDALDPASGVRRMISGFRPRSLASGAPRSSLPAWAARVQGYTAAGNTSEYTLPTNLRGPNVDTVVSGDITIVGHYLEDYEYLGDFGQVLGTDFDLDECNVRWCVTPEFPGGTYAYFVSIQEDGTPGFPYNIGRAYHGDPDSSTINGTIPAAAVTYFEGGPDTETELSSISIDDSNGDVTVVWSAAEGGSYQIEASSNLDQWNLITHDLPSEAAAAGIIETAAASTNPSRFYRARRTFLKPFDDNGFGTTAASSSLVTITVAISGSQNAPADLTTPPSLVQFNGQSVIYVSRPTLNEIQIQVDPATLGDGDYTVTAEFSGLPGTYTGTHTIDSSPKNILLLILDDWGIDASPIDNSIPPGTLLPSMPTLADMAAHGLRFTNAYSNPVCSPTRATIMTGRLPVQHDVGDPSDAGNFSVAETTLPETFAAAGSNYELASVGKWHLGGNDTGYADRGGWPEFYGITGGAVADYFSWSKNSNGNPANTTVYTTTDQVNEAVDFIGRSNTAGKPWFCWVAFNAPHSPFHDPSATDPALEPPAGYSVSDSDTSDHANYIRMLETLDLEMARLLASVDLDKTNIILIGDNGTPGQTVQAPFNGAPNAHAKGSLYEGGVHVPLVVRGPAITVPTGTTNDKLVSCVDLFSTILDLAGIDESAHVPAAANVQSRSILPILNGTDCEERSIVLEAHGGNNEGRTIRIDTHPDYKLIIFGDPVDSSDTPEFELYHLPSDPNEQTNLLLTVPLDGQNQSAYDALLAKDAALAALSEIGGSYSDPPNTVGDTLYLELPNTTGPASPPNNANVLPTLITIDDGSGTNQTAALVAREDQSDTYSRYWVKCTLPIGVSGTYSNAVVTFPNNPNNGAARVFTAIQIVVAP